MATPLMVDNSYSASRRMLATARRHTGFRRLLNYFLRSSLLFSAADDLPACGTAEALERQKPFINQTLAYHALTMMARLFGTVSCPTTVVLSILQANESRH
jgi:hypothetical protein